MNKNIKGSINPRLINEVNNMNANSDIKDFLKELLLNENSGIYSSGDFDEYKKLIENIVDKTNDNTEN